MLLNTIQGGYSTNEVEYLFQYFEMEDILIPYNIISPSQVLMGTDKGIILLDLTCTINGVKYTDINLFVEALKGE